MKRLCLLLIMVSNIFMKTAAQQNWAAVPCFQVLKVDAIGRLFNNEAQNEIILVNFDSYKICNHIYKGLFAYNGNTFHDMDLGIEAQNPNSSLGSVLINDCVEFNNKAIIIGGFLSVGSDTLYSKSIAEWDGTKWGTFPHHLWNNTPNWTTGGAFTKLLKDQGKLWMFANYDSTGNSFSSKPVVYDGTTFTPIPSIPVNNPSAITEAIIYKNKLMVTGGFYNSPNFDFFRLAQFDGTSWSQVGNGVQGGSSGVWDMEIYKDTLYIAGSFPKSAGNAGNYIMKWDGTQLTDAGLSSIFCGYGRIAKLIPYRNRLYAFGDFGCVPNQNSQIAYYENGEWTFSHDSLNNMVTSAVLYNDAIYIGGGFTSINGDSTIQKFAKLLCPDFDMATGCLSGIKELSNQINVKIFPNPAKDKIELEFEENIIIDKLSISNTLGQEVYRLIKPNTKQEIDISNLPAGIYFLKAECKQGQGTFKVVRE